VALQAVLDDQGRDVALEISVASGGDGANEQRHRGDCRRECLS
jgi:hypothetical protein